VVISQRKAPLTTDAISKSVGRAGRHASLEFPIHLHMLRHATGYKLANDGQDTQAIQHYLGHRNIQHTTRYTELASDRFKNF
jgi:type 1 fimbriae regulatory protein FimE